MSKIVALGEVLIDFLEREKSEKGYPVLEAQPGGAPANFLAAAARCGVGTSLIAKVGDDSFGHLLLNSLAEQEIDCSGVLVDEQHFTTLAFVTLGESGERSFSFARKPGADASLEGGEVDVRLIKDSDAFHFGTLSLVPGPCRMATQRAVAYAKEHGKLITFDPNLRPPLWSSMKQAKEQILWGLHQADVVKISEEEVDFALGCGPEEGAARLLEEFGCQLALVTLGEKGCYGANALGAGLVPGFTVEAVDTTGAGDVFGGTAVARLLLSGKAPQELTWQELEEIIRYANAAAGLSVGKYGGLGSAPAPEEVAALLSGC